MTERGGKACVCVLSHAYSLVQDDSILSFPKLSQQALLLLLGDLDTDATGLRRVAWEA